MCSEQRHPDCVGCVRAPCTAEYLEQLEQRVAAAELSMKVRQATIESFVEQVSMLQRDLARAHMDAGRLYEQPVVTAVLAALRVPPRG